MTVTDTGAPNIFNLTRSKKNNWKRLRLHDNFRPAKYSVICGHGKGYSKSTGIGHLKSLIHSYLKAYSEARNKIDKSIIVSDIMQAVRQEAAPEAAFVKCENNVWWEVDDSVAREKIGYMLRDRLHAQYRSSNKAKVARKKARKEFLGAKVNLSSPLQTIDQSYSPPIALLADTFHFRGNYESVQNLLSEEVDFLVPTPAPSKQMNCVSWLSNNCLDQRHTRIRRPGSLRSDAPLPFLNQSIIPNEVSSLEEVYNLFFLGDDDLAAVYEGGDLPDDISDIFEED
jgi:hypothetical protein